VETRGGERPRSKGGRPPGSNTRLTQEAIRRAEQTGLLPHEILLDMARGKPQKVQHVKTLDDGSVRVEEEWVSVDLETQKDAAKAAAPYYAPKLSTVETVQGMSDDDLDQLLASLAAEAGLAPGPGREGQEGEGQEGARARRRRADPD
jgi:hypothetical protein